MQTKFPSILWLESAFVHAHGRDTLSEPGHQFGLYLCPMDRQDRFSEPGPIFHARFVVVHPIECNVGTKEIICVDSPNLGLN